MDWYNLTSEEIKSKIDAVFSAKENLNNLHKESDKLETTRLAFTRSKLRTMVTWIIVSAVLLLLMWGVVKIAKLSDWWIAVVGIVFLIPAWYTWKSRQKLLDEYEEKLAAIWEQINEAELRFHALSEELPEYLRGDDALSILRDICSNGLAANWRETLQIYRRIKTDVYIREKAVLHLRDND
ncbi:MAG: hypothetical protein LBR73_04485 [Oscillospiraceae bacterium]|jgi:hypothetical protein|nr:hypothetical protein [Oscillospiraceae bacterium]